MAILLELMPDGFRKRLNKWRFEHFQKGNTMERSSIAAFDYYKCIFVHIPKTGGISVSDALWGNLGGVHKTMDDYSRIFSGQTLEEYFKFTFVRNPWDRLVSAYTFLKAGGQHAADAKWANKHMSGYDTFEDFVSGWINPANIYKGIHFIPQNAFLKIEGKLAVDFIGRFENIESDFDKIKNRIGLTNAVLGHKNRSVRKNYKTYYTEEARQRVAEVYSEDIQLFGYTF